MFLLLRFQDQMKEFGIKPDRAVDILKNTDNLKLTQL